MVLSGEAEEVLTFIDTKLSQGHVLALVMNGVLAFGLNVVSFTANKKTNALTMSVAGT